MPTTHTYPCGCQLLSEETLPQTFLSTCLIHRPDAYRARDLDEATPLGDLRRRSIAVEEQLTLALRAGETLLGLRIASIEVTRSAQSQPAARIAVQLTREE